MDSTVSQNSLQSRKKLGNGSVCVCKDFKDRKKLVTSWKVIKLSQLMDVSPTFVCRDTPFNEQAVKVMNYCHMFVEEYSLPLLKEKNQKLHETRCILKFSMD